MAHKIEIKELKKEGKSVVVSLALVDDITPSATVESTQVSLTLPDGITSEQADAFIADETLKYIQSWCDILKENIDKKEKSNDGKKALEVFINSNLTL